MAVLPPDPPTDDRLYFQRNWRPLIVIKDEIDKAIAAHGQWKHKLRTAIETGKSESKPDQVRADNNCGFGKWLYLHIEPQYKESPMYNKVKDLHAEFHREAGEILELALSGNQEAANDRMKLGSKFSKVSSQLVNELRSWQKVA